MSLTTVHSHDRPTPERAQALAGVRSQYQLLCSAVTTLAELSKSDPEVAELAQRAARLKTRGPPAETITFQNTWGER